MRVAPVGCACRRAHVWNVVDAKFGRAASRWIPSVASRTRRAGRVRIAAFASGATGRVIRPSTSGRAISRSRNDIPLAAFISARARALISAMSTPCGHTWVQMPQPEQ